MSAKRKKTQMSEVVKQIAEMPQDIQLRYQIRTMQHLIVNLVTALREPVADFVARKPVIEAWDGPDKMTLKTSDNLDDFLPSPKELQAMLEHCAQMPDPFLSDPTHRNAQEVAKELVKIVFRVPADFVL